LFGSKSGGPRGAKVIQKKQEIKKYPPWPKLKGRMRKNNTTKKRFGPARGVAERGEALKQQQRRKRSNSLSHTSPHSEKVSRAWLSKSPIPERKGLVYRCKWVFQNV